MKYYFLGTFGVFFTVIGLAATARADLSSSIPTNRSVVVGSAKSSQVHENHRSTLTATSMMTNLELATHNLVNQYRQFKNLPPLQIDPTISAQAKAHSEEMARISKMSHDGFNDRVKSVAQTIVYRNAAENVGFNTGYTQPDVMAVKGWIESPGHRHNMIGQFDLTGIGVAKNARGEYYFTQIFIRKAWYVKDAD
jgi:uncharacterized protein YkwD